MICSQRCGLLLMVLVVDSSSINTTVLLPSPPPPKSLNLSIEKQDGLWDEDETDYKDRERELSNHKAKCIDHSTEEGSCFIV